MAEPHVLTALVRKRAEYAGRIEHAQTTLRQLIIDLDNLDATIRIFAPDIDLEVIRPKPLPPRNQAFKGEMTRLLLSALRLAQEPLSTSQLTRHVMAERGLNSADSRLLLTLGKRVGAALRHLRGKGLVRSEEGPEHVLVWAVVR